MQAAAGRLDTATFIQQDTAASVTKVIFIVFLGPLKQTPKITKKKKKKRMGEAVLPLDCRYCYKQMKCANASRRNKYSLKSNL